jgi:predicted RNA-binding Zn-ribbon protein involved in translation (DUF1610 family)
MWYAGAVESPFEAAATGRSMAKGRSLLEFQETFPDEARCAAFLSERRWPKGFVCPGCGKQRAAALKSRAYTYECLDCGRQPVDIHQRANGQGCAAMTVGPRSPGTSLQLRCSIMGLGARRNAMLHLFLTPSSLLVAEEVLVGFPPNVRRSPNCGLGDRFKQSVGRLHPRPETPALSLPERLSIIYTRRKEFVGRRFMPRGMPPLQRSVTPSRLTRPPDGSFIALACVAAFRRSSAGP